MIVVSRARSTETPSLNLTTTNPDGVFDAAHLGVRQETGQAFYCRSVKASKTAEQPYNVSNWLVQPRHAMHGQDSRLAVNLPG